ncbi:MAG: D-alanyl-D-alanine dipeptidase [Alphaproteobacteria bacterium 16-39-46]|nr:MAG: D-alanyl-D-alanine dipeptidase [Alphaproteobacteria bacterium 16-39-46]OZA44215.1 MAG: D-alanyl-D-alanine dipeptidase [Alphaproteobacteria bacterium 17-39-52]
MLVEIKKNSPGIILEIAYATSGVLNFTKTPVYKNPFCFLHKTAAEKIHAIAARAQNLGFFLKIFDAFRPTEAQWKLWEFCPNPTFVADPKRGSAHSRGIAVDLTLVDGQTYDELEMGTPFDDFTELSFHGNSDISPVAQKNRLLLLGLMTEGGFDFYAKEWWHYQLFEAQSYPLLSDKDAPHAMMS